MVVLVRELGALGKDDSQYSAVALTCSLQVTKTLPMANSWSHLSIFIILLF